MMPSRFVATKDILFALYKATGKTRITITKLQDTLAYIFRHLAENKLLDNYNIMFNLTPISIERIAAYNQNELRYDHHEDAFYLRTPERLDALTEQHKLPPDIQTAITEFISTNI